MSRTTHYPAAEVAPCRRILSAWRIACVLVALLSCVTTPAAHAVDSDTGEPQYVVVKAQRAITVSGEEFAPATIVIEDGKISAVGGDIEYPPSAKLVKADRQTVLPGFIHARSRHGLASYKRSGVNGDQAVASEVWPSDMDFDDLLEAGYTAVCFVPDGTGITGTAAVFKTAGSDEDRKLTDAAYLYVAPGWTTNGKKTLREALEKAKEEIEKVEKARKEWEEKQKEEEAKKQEQDEEKPEEEGEEEEGEENGDEAVSRSLKALADDDDGQDDDEKKPEESDAKKDKDEKKEFEPPKIDPKYQPLVDLIQKKEGAFMMVRLGRASDVRHLEDVLKPYDDLAYKLFADVDSWRSSDFHHVVDALGEAGTTVVLSPRISRMPYTTFRFNLMKKLIDAGCEVASVPSRDSRSAYLRIRERLMLLVRAGLSKEEAIKSLTLYPANAIGLGDRLGSIEKGKDADLVFLDGDPLDPLAKVVRVMILGDVVWEAGEK